MLRRIVLAMLLCLLALHLAGCGGDEKAPSKSKAPAARKADGEEKAARSNSMPKGKKWGGWRWKGKRDDCFFVHNNKCFTTREDACDAAGCKKGKCVFDKSAPAKASCKE